MSQEESRIIVVEDGWSAAQAARAIVSGGALNAFYVGDLRELAARRARWRALLPRVEPFYAVKCNADAPLLRALAALGAGFDCASRGEIELITGLGVAPERIIYANTLKAASHLRYAASVGVRLTTFDSKAELIKIKQLMPHAQVVLRIRCDAAHAQLSFGARFGCDPETEAPALLKMAAELGLDLVGVSFHVGSGAKEIEIDAYARAIRHCRDVFDLGAEMGHARMRLVDIGGGFSGGSGTSIEEASAVINAALEEHFPDRRVRVIAEPGRYFAAAVYSLAVMVHSKRVVAPTNDSGEAHTMYSINDGVFSSFNAVLTCGEKVQPILLHPSEEKPQPCSIWGQTCSPLDCVVPSTALPPLQLGSWLLFPDMGAYSLTTSCGFNGFSTGRVISFADRQLWTLLKTQWPSLECQDWAELCQTALETQSPLACAPPTAELTNPKPTCIINGNGAILNTCHLSLRVGGEGVEVNRNGEKCEKGIK